MPFNYLSGCASSDREDEEQIDEVIMEEELPQGFKFTICKENECIFKLKY